MSKEYLYDSGLLDADADADAIRLQISEEYEELNEFKEKAGGGFYFIDESGPSFNSKGELNLKIPSKILNLALGSKEIYVDIGSIIGIDLEGQEQEIEVSIQKSDWVRREVEEIKEGEVDFCSGEIKSESEFKEKICKRLNQRIPTKAFCNFRKQGNPIELTVETEGEEEIYSFSPSISVKIKSSINVTYHKKIKVWSYYIMDMDISCSVFSSSEFPTEVEPSWIPALDVRRLFETGDFTKEEACNSGFDGSYYYIPSDKKWIYVPPSSDGVSNIVATTSSAKEIRAEDVGLNLEPKEFNFGNNLYLRLLCKKRTQEPERIETFLKEINPLSITTLSKYNYKEFLA